MKRWIPAAVVVVLVKLSTSCIADDEFLCEEAVAHLEDCCANFDPSRVRCSSEFKACGGNLGLTCDPHFTSTELSPRASRCILDKSCGQLTSAICTDIQNPTESRDNAEATSCQ